MAEFADSTASLAVGEQNFGLPFFTYLPSNSGAAGHGHCALSLVGQQPSDGDIAGRFTGTFSFCTAPIG